MFPSHPSATAFMVESPQRTSPIAPNIIQLYILSFRVILRVLCLGSLILQPTLSTTMVLVDVAPEEEESRPMLCNNRNGEELSCGINLACSCQFRLKDINRTKSNCGLFLATLWSSSRSAQKCPLNSPLNTNSQAGHGSSIG